MRTFWMLPALLTTLLAACGGGGDTAAPPPAAQPTITAFAADKATYLMGERAQLTPVFGGGSGRIEPGIGPVLSGVPVTTPPLDGDGAYRLVVEAAGQPVASRTLNLPVAHRDRFAEAGTFDSMFHSALELPDGGVLIVGGYRGGNVKSNAIDRFDPATRTFTRLAEMATGRGSAQLVALADGSVLIAGGDTTAASGITYERFDPRTNQVSAAGVPFRNRLGHTATRLADGRVLIAGGIEDNTAELWDPATRSARPVAARMSNPREWHSATLLADGRVLLVGGFTLASTYWLAELFDPRTEQFTPLGAPMLVPVVNTLGLHLAHRLADGRVLIVGGERFNPSVDSGGRPTADAWLIDPATGAATAQPGLLAPRTLFTGVALPDDRVLLFGGATVDTLGLSTGEVYRAGRPATPTAPLDVGRAFHTVSRLPGGRVLIVGGSTPTGAFASRVLIYD